MSLAACFLLGLALGAPAAWAQTPDEETPAVEDACDGFSGKIYGLCNAYCEAMDCDADEPQASDQACTRVFDKIVAANEGPFPFCGDQDGDGVPNGVDNCPAVANPAQDDANNNGVGDLCEPVACPCLVNIDGTPTDVDGWIAQASNFFTTYPIGPAPTELCTPNTHYLLQPDSGVDPSKTGLYLLVEGIEETRVCTSVRFDDTLTYSISNGGLPEDQFQACEDAMVAIQTADPLDVCP
jgi:hypothetical protein